MQKTQCFTLFLWSMAVKSFSPWEFPGTSNSHDHARTLEHPPTPVLITWISWQTTYTHRMLFCRKVVANLQMSGRTVRWLWYGGLQIVAGCDRISGNWWTPYQLKNYVIPIITSWLFAHTSRLFLPSKLMWLLLPPLYFLLSLSIRIKSSTKGMRDVMQRD